MREFLAVADHLNFNRAAEELHITRPALSKHIKALETELGFELFDRSGATKLTPEGERFYVCAQRTLSTLDDGIEECRSLSKRPSPVRILWSGLESEIFRDMMPFLKTPYKAIRPEKEYLSPISALSDGLADVVLAYNIELTPGFGEEMEQSRLSSLPLGEERIAILMSSRNPLAKKENLRSEDLDGAEVLYAQGTIYKNYVSHLETALGSITRVPEGMKFISEPALTDTRDLLYYDFGRMILFTSDDIAKQVMDGRRDMAIFSELDGKALIQQTSIVYRKNDPNPNVRAFVREVERLAKTAASDKDGKYGGGDAAQAVEAQRAGPQETVAEA